MNEIWDENTYLKLISQGELIWKDKHRKMMDDSLNRELALMQLLDKFNVQIAVYFGREGGLAVLQDGMRKMEEGEQIMCYHCGGSLYNPAFGHNEGCRLVRDYLVLFGEQ